MNLEEALGRITDPEVKAFFQKMTSDQNSYITKLESQLKERAAAQGATPASNDITQEYIRKKMREEVIANASKVIIASYGEKVFEAVKPDFDAFLEKNLKPENTTDGYIIDAFNLVFGRCCAQKDHQVHAALAGKDANPGGTPVPQPVGTNGQQVATVQNVIAGQPPVMSGADTSAGQGLPGVQGTPVKNTKDAFARFKGRLAGDGGNKFQ